MLIILKSLSRGMGDRVVLHPTSASDQYGAEMPKHDVEPAGKLFDCVNKPIYTCSLKVDRAGSRCAECVVRTAERSVFDI